MMIQLILLLLLFPLVMLILLVRVSENTEVDDETFKSNDNEDLQGAYNKLFEVSLALKK